MSSKIQKKRRTQKSRRLEVNTEAIKILRMVKDEEAFYFYEDTGKPTGESAKSLSDFLEKIKTVKLESLQFHLQRKDFQNWIEKTLGDSNLARKIERISPSNDEALRTKIQSNIESRLKELKEASIPLLVNENLTATSLSSAS
jgi:hypothetical protein